jgi:hypothetical protein
MTQLNQNDSMVGGTPTIYEIAILSASGRCATDLGYQLSNELTKLFD